MKKKITGAFAVCCAVLFLGLTAQAQSTVADEIIRDYKNSKTFADFLALQQPKILPGDDVFLYKKMQNSKDMLAAKKLPSLNYFNGAFNLKYLDSSIQLRLVDKDKFDFEINGQRVVLHPSMVPSIRFARINEIIIPKKTSFISWMPVAFAQQNGEPTFSNIITFSIVSRLALEAAGGLEIKTENPKVSFLYFMKKMRQKKTPCDYIYLTEVLRKMSAIQVSTLRCEATHKNKNGDGVLNGNIQFELPFGDGLYRKLTVNRGEQSISEESPDYPGKKITYKRIFSDDSVVFSPLSPLVSQVYNGGKQAKRSIRQKGLAWTPVGSFGANIGEIQERAEQVREFAHVVTSTDFCLRCGLTLQKAIKEIAKELEMNPDLDQFGNLNSQGVQPQKESSDTVIAPGTSTPSVMDLPPTNPIEQYNNDPLSPDSMQNLGAPPPPTAAPGAPGGGAEAPVPPVTAPAAPSGK